MVHGIAQSTRCTSVRPNGQFCDYESLPDAPFPICLKHAAQVMRYLDGHIPRTIEDRIILTGRGIVQGRARQAPGEERRERLSVVYYLRVGSLIKIGRTDNLPKRLQAYPPDSVLLTTEPGAERVERQRHAQFRAFLRHGQEWFEPGAELMAHIANLKRAKSA